MCRYYLIGACKFGERCSYVHSKEYLLQQGWWSTEEGLEKERRRYNVIQMCNKALADHNRQIQTSGTGKAPKKGQSKVKKVTVALAQGLGVRGSNNQFSGVGMVIKEDPHEGEPKPCGSLLGRARLGRR